MSKPISEIKGIEPKVKDKLEAEGIRNTEQFFEHAHTTKQRTELAHKVGVTQVVIKELANRADLMRLSGVGSVYSKLLEEAGVHSCKELQHRTPEHLLNTLEELNTSKKLSQHVPTLVQIILASGKGVSPFRSPEGILLFVRGQHAHVRLSVARESRSRPIAW